MNRACLLAAVLAALALSPYPLYGEPTPAVDVEMLRRKQEHQQRARDLARELVSSILDIQLQQLSENGLEHLPLYRDISQMRTHLDGLVEAEMADVVNLLLKAQDQLPAEREATFVEARKKTREVVVRLSIERQNLLRRLKTAELAAQVKRLIAMQTIVTNATQSLPAQPSTRQEAALVATIQDERDVQALFTRLLEMLREVRGWGGEVGQGAAEGLATLRTAAVGQRLADAIADLEMAEFDQAGEQEAAVLKGLRLLLEKIEETQGLVGTDRELALENVRQLIARQTQLRDDTRAAELDEATIDKLIERQATLQKEIGRLPEMLNRVPAALPAVEAARRAASSASARIFDGKREPAVAQQTAAAAQLEAVEQHLLTAALRTDGAQSAAELKSLAEALAEAQKQIERAQAETAEAKTDVQKQAAEAAAKHLARAAEQLAAIEPAAVFPEAVKSAIEEAADQTQRAAQAARKADAKAAEATDSPLPAATRAQQHAQSEVAAALADARRNMLSTRFEELSKAAEALDRAAGAQRNVAAQAEKAAQSAPAEGLPSEQSKALAAQETAVGQVAKKVTEAVAQSAPKAAEPLEQAAAAIEATRRELEPAESSQTKPDARRVAQQAEQAVAPLKSAADQLRSAAAEAARQLDAESRRQLAELEPVRDAAAQASMGMPAADETAEKLAQAEQVVRAALAHQMRASGQPEAARASELADRLQKIEREQQAVEQAASDPATSADAAAKQQQVADQIRHAQAAHAASQPAAQAEPEDNSPELARALEQASEAAAAAAKAMQAGESEAAERSRGAAQKAVAAAKRAAQEQADRAAQQPAGQPDADAQPRVTAAIDEARQLARSGAPQADKALGEAQPASQDAEQKLQAGDAEGARDQQQKAATALQRAAEMLQKAIEARARQEAARLATKADQAAKLAAAAAPLDPAAVSALQSAEQAGHRPSQQQPNSQQQSSSQQQSNSQSPSQPPSADPAATHAATRQMNQDLQRAAASLAARDQRIRHAQAMAGQLLKAAENQRQAASEIDTGRQALAAASHQPNSKTATPAALAKPATKLKQAMKRYAEAANAGQRAAEEASDTSGIADPALADALEAAAKLRPAPPAPATASAPAPAATASAAPSLTAPTSSAAAAAKSAADEAADAKTGQLSAEETARMLAGTEALEQLQAAQRAAPGQSVQPQTGQSAAATNPAAAAQATAQTKPQSAAAANVQSTSGSRSEPGIREPGSRGDDARPGQRTFREEPWVAKLPPELRQAIRAQSQRRPPAAYEERLRRYFENID
ncbi:MAG TPA: hypothetical protein VHV55_23060 [Pirellulales bacterium]|jgi:hypothetical protein|nr:hypothetical protein [Pirellulales bacterium]